MAASAAFHFDAQASLLKKSATPAGTVTLTLDSVTGVDSILWTVSLTCENSAGGWVITGSTANNATLTVPNVTDIACIIQCRVNGGTRVDPTTGVQSVGDLVKTAKVYTGTEVIVTGETTESDATYGWAPVVNAVITSGGGGVALSNVAPSAVGTASAGVGTDASRYDHVHAHGNQAAGSSMHAAADGSNNGFMSSAHYTAVNGRAEGPTVSVIPVRSSAGRLRAVSYSLETDTDGNRLIHALQADATTYDTLGARTTALSVTDGTGAYGQTYTPAAAATLVYGNDLTSLTDRITQAGSGAGKSRYILGGLGASGSANGVFVSGLENGNTVLGGAHWLGAGSLVSNVSDKIRFGTGTPGSMTSFLDVYQDGASLTRITAGFGSLRIGNLTENEIYIAGSGVTTITANANIVMIGGTSCSMVSAFVEIAGQVSSAPNAVAYAASITLDCNLSNHHQIGAMTGAITTLTLSNARAGAVYTIEVLEDGSGGHASPTFNANFKFGATYTNAHDSVANHRTIWTFLARSTTDWRCIGKETYSS